MEENLDYIKQQFLDHLRADGISEATLRFYASDLNHFEKWLLVKLANLGSIATVLSEALPFLSSKIAEDYKIDLNCASNPIATSNRRLSTLRRFSNFVFASGYVGYDFAQNLTNIPKSKIKQSQTMSANVDQFLSGFEKYLIAKKKSANTIRNYLADVRQFLTQNPSNITSETVKAYQAAISNLLSKSSAKRKASAINKFLEWAGQEGYITTDSSAKLPVSRQLPAAKLLAWASFTAGMAVFTFAFVQQVKLPIQKTQPQAQFILQETPTVAPAPPTEFTPEATPEATVEPTPESQVLAALDAVGSLSITTLSVDDDLDLTGNLKIGGVTRFNSLGRLASITGYYQDSGLFEIDQGAADWARLEKVMTAATGAASNDVLTLTLDESALTTGSNYDTLTLNRTNAASDGYALLVDNGNVRFDGDVSYVGTLTDVSDIRLKENLQDIQNPLEILQGINGQFFNMIGSDRKEVGVIAQDVQLVLPEAVSTVDEQNGYLGVSYTSLIPVMIEGIKELTNITNEISLRTKIVSPVVETEFLSPVPEHNLIVQLAESSKFRIQNSKEEVASIDSSGNATFSGEVRAEKLYSTNLNEIETTLRKAEQDINLLVGQDITISDQVELVNVITDKLNILLANTLRVEANGDVTITGNLYVAGKTTTKELETNKLIIANPTIPDTPGVSGAIESNSSAGWAKIASGSAQITVKNPNVSLNSLIYVTPTTASGNQVLYVKDKQAGSFVVGYEEPVDFEVQFNWWVLDLYDQ